MTPATIAGNLQETARQIAVNVAAPAADSVDRDARFPTEAMEALRDERLLGAFVPRELGGFGCSIGELAAMCEALGRGCASTAMIFAMHQINVACLVRHCETSTFFRDYLADLVRYQRLIASATSEVGVGGDLRQSVCGVDARDGRLRVTKSAPVVSYGEEADDILLTARRTLDATASDQVIVLVRQAETRLTRAGDWDTLGMRGTRSLGFTIDARGSVDQIVPVPFADVAAQTMIPVSHVLWSALWLGLASDAVSRARAFVRSEARRSPGTAPPAAPALAETVAELNTMRAVVHSGRDDFERHQHDSDALAGLGFAIRMNTLKLTASRMAPDIVARALGVCGVSGYRCNTPYALGRHLRDAHSAALMISNDRLVAANAAMLLLHRED